MSFSLSRLAPNVPRKCSNCKSQHQVKFTETHCPACQAEYSPTPKAQFLTLISLLVVVWLWWDFIGQGSSSETSQEELSEASIKFDAQYACQEAVRKQSRFRTKADFGVSTEVMHGNAVISSGRVELMNGFGNMIPHRYSCLVDSETMKVLAVEVNEG